MTTKKAAPKGKLPPKDALPEQFPEQLEIEGDANIVPKIAKLERKAREIADRRDRIKNLKEDEAALTEAALAIMHDHEITRYARDGVVLNIDATEKLKVAVD